MAKCNHVRTGGIMPEFTSIVYTTSEFTTITGSSSLLFTGTSGTTNKGNPKISGSNNL